MKWRPAAEFEPKRGETYLVAYDDGLEAGQFWCLVVGSIYPNTEGRPAIWPFMGGTDSHCVDWEDVSYVIPYEELRPTQSTPGLFERIAGWIRARLEARP